MPVRSDGLVEVAVAEAWVRTNIDSTQRRRSQSRRALATPAAPIALATTAIDHLDPTQRATVAAMIAVAEGVPFITATTAAELGMGIEAARLLFDRTAAEVRLWVADLLDETAIEPPPGCDRWNPSPLPESLTFLPVTDADLTEGAGLPPRAARG